MEYTYKTSGSCCSEIYLEVEGGVVREVRFTGGCHGNLQGIPALVKGMEVKEVVARLDGILCKRAQVTSCPDQLAQALKQIQ